MTPDRREDLVSMTAIVAGAVVSVVVTVVSMIMSDEEPRRVPGPESQLSIVVSIDEDVEVDVDLDGEIADDVFLDPRGPERGPTDFEWMVIQAYKPIESMTASEPSTEVVDYSLARLELFAISTPGNPFVQELYLKGLRVAQYWAMAAGDEERSTILASRFEAYRTVSVPTRQTAMEGIRFDIQRLDQNCHAAAPRVDAMTSAAEPFMTDPGVVSALEYGLALAYKRCGVAASA